MILLMIKSTIPILLAACAAACLKRQSSAMRHLIWTAGLIGAMAAPLCGLLLPPWRSRFAGMAADFADALAVSTAGPPGSGGSALMETAALASAGFWGLSGVALIVWLTGAALSLLFLFAAAARLSRATASAKPVSDPRWTAATRELAGALNLRRPVLLLQSAAIGAVGAWGILHPRILLPPDAETWSDRRIRMTLAHELAHIQRNDWPLQILAEAARAIYWFNPAFWLAASRLRQESEQACDDAALRLGFSGPEYAEELIALARSLRDTVRSRAAILAMAEPSHLEKRLAALLDPARRRLTATPWSAVAIILAAIGLTAPLAALRFPVGPPERGAAACPVTPSVWATPPEAGDIAAFGAGPWFINADRTLWVWDQPYVAGRMINTVWIRPQGAILSVVGKRLDADAPTLEAHIPCCYPMEFKTSGIRFPAPGCWEITATAGDSALTFITEVHDRKEDP